jgi:hypothetical protein
MAIMVSNTSGGGFTPHPEGDFSAICVDVHDLGYIDVQYAGNVSRKHKIEVYFFCGEWKKKEDGALLPLLVRKRFTATLHEKGILRPFLESWRGRKFTQQEEAGFDLESLIGAPAYVQVLHNQVGENVYANVQTIMRLPKGSEAPQMPADFVRVKDRPARDDANGGEQERRAQSVSVSAPARDWSSEDDDDSLPF